MKIKVAATILTCMIGACTFASSALAASLAGATAREGDIFILASGLTLAMANLQLGLDRKTPLYCPPEQNSLSSTPVLWALVDRTLVGPHAPEVIVIALIDALKTDFPC